MTDPSPLEQRQAEDAEFERKRRRSLEFIALDMWAAQYGMAEWQRLRRLHPEAFFQAKFDVRGGPPGMRISVGWNHDRTELVCWFEWPAVRRVARLLRGIDFRTLMRAEDADGDSGFLKYCADWMAREVTYETGVETRIEVRGNREAWDWHESHKGDLAQALAPLPPRKRIAGRFCGTCGARFRTEALAAAGYCAGSYPTPPLPCGHPAVGVWTEDEA